MARVVYASYNPFTKEVWVGAHYYSSLFARHGHRVMYLADADFIFHHFDRRKHVWEGRKEWFYQRKQGTVHISPGLTQLVPESFLPVLNKVWPFNTSFAAATSVKITWPRVHWNIRRLGFNRPDIFWLENAKYVYLADRIKPALMVQRVHDQTLASPVETHLKNLFIRSLRKSHHIFCMSKSLMQDYVLELSGDPSKVHYLPNGVAAKWFEVPEIINEPDDLKDIPGPRVIMVGVFEFWVDYPKLWSLAEKMPNLSFVMVGPVRVVLPNNKPKNIHFLGKKPHDQLPAYLRHSQLGLSIFKRMPFTEYVNLIKLYEYLAMGLPAVSTAHRELQMIQAPWLLADSVEEFQRAIQTGLEMRESERESLVSFARENTWEKRFETVLEVLDL